MVYQGLPSTLVHQSLFRDKMRVALRPIEVACPLGCDVTISSVSKFGHPHSPKITHSPIPLGDHSLSILNPTGHLPLARPQSAPVQTSSEPLRGEIRRWRKESRRVCALQ
ncbi:hypothetical protein M404DRAFT_991846 [Pisolithus tinctorius Marx 270]|uniref:Uncharacterized protein n=1 Tax=Pisolithus tinctorius Marx 270 TaxID=870435 RepID=A0A0C3L021_PISTI|nr:hypothetical protein M404DRAFT_991846 [Pisolithus tinctorius Marx 270]